MYADKYVHSSDDVPKVQHWAILKFGSVTIPGDERSRTCPGHGYPEHSETTIDYEAYLTEEKWKAEIQSLETSAYKKSYVALKVNPATIKVEAKVSIE